MAVYCTLADVKAYLTTVTISSATTPTEAQTSDYIDLVSAEISGLLRSRLVSVPPTDTDAADYLRTIAVYGVAAAVLAAKFGHGSDGAQAADARYRDCLAAIRDGAMDMYAAISGTHFGEGFSVDSSGAARTPAVTKETTF